MRVRLIQPTGLGNVIIPGHQRDFGVVAESTQGFAIFLNR
jgi:hypothetical protein